MALGFISFKMRMLIFSPCVHLAPLFAPASRTAGTGTGAWGRAARVSIATRGGERMVEDSAVIKQHYHMIYKEKMPHGSVKIEFNIYAPRSEIAAAFAAVDEILKREVENYASET